MLKALRILAGLFIVALLLYAATWAVRDCPTGLYTYDNCLWLSLSKRLDLPPNKLLSAAALELVGLTLLTGLYLTARYIFPRWSGSRSSRQESGQLRDSDSARKASA